MFIIQGGTELTRRLPHTPSDRDKQTALRPVDAAAADWSSLVLRYAAVAAQAVTICITWPLWQVRVFQPLAEAPLPPLLPLLPLPQIEMGPWLLASLVVVLILPRWGVLLHAGLLALAVAMDQMRLQPEFISLVLLMVGSLDMPGAKLLARSHLLAPLVLRRAAQAAQPRLL